MKIAVTGSRPFNIGSKAEQDLARKALFKRLDDLKPEQVFSGMALGPDEWALHWCIENRVKFHACIPYPQWQEKWNYLSQALPMNGSIKEAEFMGIYTETVVSDYYYTDVYMVRNRYMVNKLDINTDRVLGVWNGKKGGCKSTMDFAHSRGYTVERIVW